MKEIMERLTAAKKEAGDYIQDGLTYCGKCRTPKECVVDLLGEIRYVPCLCKCQREAEAERERRFYAEQQRLLVNRLQVSGIEDKQMHSWTFDQDDGRSRENSQKLRNYCREWRKMYRENIGLLLWGGPGTGKTFLAACVANELISQGVPVLMTDFIRLGQGLENARDKNGFIGSLHHYKLLVIDDLGAERGSEYMQEKVYEVIDTRYRDRQPVIITTNLQLEELRNAPSLTVGRIYDRLNEMTVPIMFKGGSRRKEIFARKRELARELLSEDQG